jgi:hypothetical protein
MDGGQSEWVHRIDVQLAKARKRLEDVRDSEKTD